MFSFYILMSFTDGPVYFIQYWADKNIDDEIEDAIVNFQGEDDLEYEDFVKDIMYSFALDWHYVPLRVFNI